MLLGRKYTGKLGSGVRANFARIYLALGPISDWLSARCPEAYRGVGALVLQLVLAALELRPPFLFRQIVPDPRCQPKTIWSCPIRQGALFDRPITKPIIRSLYPRHKLLKRGSNHVNHPAFG